MAEIPRRSGDLLPWERRFDEPRQPVPASIPDNTAERKTLIYGPNGERLIVQEPRPVGFRDRR